MMVETHVDRARDRVAAELSTARDRRQAFHRFVDRVDDVQVEPPATSAGTTTGTTAGDRPQGSEPDGGSGALRTAFAETVHGVGAGEAADRSVQAALREEFSPAVAAALAPTSGATPTPAVRRGILERARTRLAETRVLERALEREADSLAAVGTTVDEVTDWLIAENPTPLSELGFGELQSRHERLAAFRGRCREAVHDRQDLLQATTSLDGRAGLRHRSLLETCYRDFPVDHPALATLVALEDTCATAQRSLRAELVTRG